MARRYFKKMLGGIAVLGLLLGAFGFAAGPASAGKGIIKISGVPTTSTSSIDTNGGYSYTVEEQTEGAAQVDVGAVTIQGKLPTGSGIGSRTATTRATLEQGTTNSYSGAFTFKKMTPSSPPANTVTASITPPNGGSQPSSVSVSIHCEITYPPLAITCTISMSWSAS